MFQKFLTSHLGLESRTIIKNWNTKISIHTFHEIPIGIRGEITILGCVSKIWNLIQFKLLQHQQNCFGYNGGMLRWRQWKGIKFCKAT